MIYQKIYNPLKFVGIVIPGAEILSSLIANTESSRLQLGSLEKGVLPGSLSENAASGELKM